ncbi:hypothetical protein AB834_02040 [PVC group bacterium (ex Bugula neritina AB1)]|nr:hypothetical protein AB834_02040 [PVC group bacterium (ex Bugula neritina AB1)]
MHYNRIKILCVIFFAFYSTTLNAYWVWNTKSKKWSNPKHSVKGTAEDQFLWAKKFYEEGEYKKALKGFQKLMKKYPRSRYSPEAGFLSGSCLMNLGQYYDAYLIFQKVLKKYPGFSQVEEIVKKQVQIGNHYFYKKGFNIGKVTFPKNNDHAIEIFQGIIENSPYGEYAPYAHFYLAESYRLINRFEDAIRMYEALIDKFPKSEYVAESRYKIILSSSHFVTKDGYTEKDLDEAKLEFEIYMKKHAKTARGHIAQKEIDDLNQKDAQKILETAQWYEKKKKYKAALLYYRDFYRKYKNHEESEGVKDKINVLSMN